MRRWIRRIWLSCGLLFTGFMVWSAQAHGVDPAMLKSSANVRVVDTGALIQFLPANAARGAGLVFLPGGGIDPEAYAPLLHSVAESGHAAVLVRMPWRTAPTAGTQRTLWQRIDVVVGKNNPGQAWVLSGHSRGAALASTYMSERSGKLTGLVLIGTTHPRDVDLSKTSVPVAKIYGTRDCVADTAKMKANARLLPPATQWIRIAGANHRQFGYYGYQLGDCSATISRTAQQARTARALIEFLGSVRVATR
jgi:pimeloyl-ACP methyl ester carboxylesterase